MTNDKIPADKIDFSAAGPVNDLFFAINHYVSTGDHIGEGMAMDPAGDPERLMIALPVSLTNTVDQADFALFRGRLAEIAEDGIETIWEDHGPDRGFHFWSFRVRHWDIEALTAALKAKPSARGWGSMKAVIDAAFGSGKRA